jgi:hypothetical protein
LTQNLDAVRYINVGERSALLSDETLSFTHDGEPVESVIWLKNGGGKSSMIALESAVVLPTKNDFTGSGREGSAKRPRQLEDYIPDGTGHTVLAWSTPDIGSIFGGRRRLLIGAVYEWPDRRRPASDAAARPATKWWWSATPLPGALTLDELPAKDASGRQLTSAQFKDRLRNLNTEHPELQLQIRDTMGSWTSHLDELGIDTALHRYQARMNRSEGGISKIFTFDSAATFVDFILDMVAAPSQANECAGILTQHASNLFARPVHLLEQRFLADAGRRLSELAAAHEAVTSAHQRNRDAARTAAGLRAGVIAAADARAQRAAEQRERHEELGTRITGTRRERQRVENWRDELLRLAALERQHDAERALKQAETARDDAAAAHVAWQATEFLLEAAELDARAAQILEQLQPERAERATLARSHDVAAAAVRDLLAQSIAEHTKAADTASAQARERRATEKRERANARAARNEAARAGAEAAALRATLEAHRLALVAARERTVIGEQEAPADAAERHRAAAAALRGRAAELKTAASRDEEAAAAEAKQAQGAAAAAVRLSGQADQGERERDALAAEHDALASHPRLLELAEAEERVALWEQAEQLRAALLNAARDTDARALAEAVRAAEDDRLVAGVADSGLLPAPAEVQAVLAELHRHALGADTAWTVLSRDHGPGVADALANARPELATSVVVQDDAALAAAVAALSSFAVTSHIALTTVTALARALSDVRGQQPAGAALPAAVPLHAGLHDAGAAAAAAEAVRAAGSDRVELRGRLEASALADRLLHHQLTEFLREHPHADLLERLASELMQLRTDAGAQERDAAARRGRAELLTSRAGASREEAAGAVRKADGAERDSETAQDLAEAELAHAPLAERAAGAERRRDDAEDQAEQADRRAGEAGERAGVLSGAAQQRAQQASVERRERDQVSVLDGSRPASDVGFNRDVAARQGAGLAACTAAYAQLSEQYRLRASASVLEAELAGAKAGADKARAAARTRYERHTGPGGASSAEALATSYLAEPTLTANGVQARIDGAQHEASATATAATRAESVLEAAQARVADLTPRDRPRHTGDDVGYADPEQAERRAEQLAAEATALSERETALESDRNEASAKAAVLEQQSGRLSDLAAGLAVRGEESAADIVAVSIGADMEPDAVRELVTAASAAITAAKDEFDLALALRAEAGTAAVRLAADEQYKDLASTLRARFSDSDAASLAARAAVLGEQVELRARMIAEQLAVSAKAQDSVTTVVTSHVEQLLSAIEGAARASRIPDGLGEMSGHNFFTIRFEHPDATELTSRVAQKIAEVLDAASGSVAMLPSGDRLLKHCVHAAVGVRGFRAHVLKPNEHMLAQQVPVADVSLFSDGEKLTTCVLLFCAFARMRQHGRGSAATTGTLILDNPFGQASAAELIALQLAVAAAQRVHLVFATGLEDMGALLQFRQIIRLKNRKAEGSVAGFIRPQEPGGAAPGARVVTGTSVSRSDAPVPPVLRTDLVPAQAAAQGSAAAAAAAAADRPVENAADGAA